LARGEEAVRREAVRRRLAGESPEAIARSLGRTRQWVARWVRRYDPADPEWANERSRAPHVVANRTPAEVEAQVLAVRERLEQHPWAQVGAEAIAWQLRELGLAIPTTRTIERILQRAGKVRRRRSKRPEPKGVPYPAPPAESVGDLHQADIVGPRHLDGGVPFLALNVIDLAAHSAAIEIVADQGERSLSAAVVAAFERLGVPRRLQLDNGTPFLLGSAAFGEVVRVVLHQGATPVFIPQRKPWRNGVIERFNDSFEQRFFRSERFATRDGVRTRALEFERFHNANHRYRATGRRTPDELSQNADRRPPKPLVAVPQGWPQQGRVEFIRFIRSDRKLRLLRRTVTMPERLAYHYVTATLDLALPVTEGNLLITDHHGELFMRTSLPTPG
jgi:putative transposase